jgi:lipopolysaccharide/colanic/teichoic acid biosynthesis glycosyltransferase
MEYIRNWNLLLDLKIMFLTVFGRKKNNLAPGKDIALEFQRIVGSTR